MTVKTQKPRKHLHLAAPRGFCAGVDRAVRIVEVAIERFGAPVYVRHEIVHNRTVVDALAAKGAVFVEELAEVPDGAPVVFSAHGVPRAVVAEASRREMVAVDATCPLVMKVHVEARRHAAGKRHVLLIGHAGHPEVEGTMGQVEPGQMTLVETAEDARRVAPPLDAELAFSTQTTLSVDDTAEIIEILRTRFPDISAPRGEDICYATTNRQNAVKHIAPKCDLVLVVGAQNSSNSQRLVEVAHRAGASKSLLVANLAAIDWADVDKATHIGLSAGASAPESLILEIIDEMRRRYELELDENALVEESVSFKLPSVLAEQTNGAKQTIGAKQAIDAEQTTGAKQTTGAERTIDAERTTSAGQSTLAKQSTVAGASQSAGQPASAPTCQPASQPDGQSAGKPAGQAQRG